MARPPSMGRRKIEIRRIESKDARQVCFSKRRAGLFKKAYELAIQCGVELAIVVFSPGRNAYSFGHPSVEAILQRFAPSPNGQAGRGGAGAGVVGEDNAELEEINRQYGELRAQVDMAKARKERLHAAMAKEDGAAAWLDADVHSMGEVELVSFAAELEKVQAAIAASADRVLLNTLNNDLATMVARSRPSSNNQVQLLPQPFPANNGVVFDGQFGAAGINNTSNNSVMMDMQMQMMMEMPLPSLGFNGTGIETMLHEGSFGFFGPY